MAKLNFLQLLCSLQCFISLFHHSNMLMAQETFLIIRKQLLKIFVETMQLF